MAWLEQLFADYGGTAVAVLLGLVLLVVLVACADGWPLRRRPREPRQ